MIPRVDVAAIDVAQPRELALEEIRARSVSHLLAVDGNLDRDVGMLDAHAVMLNPDVALRTLVRPVPAVPAIGTARGALTVLQERGATLALAVDEYGGTAGLVAMNDLIAEVVGEMADEHFEPARRVVARDRERFLVAGWTSLREWRERTGSDEGDESVATVGGLVVSRLDRPPRVGDVATTAGFEYVVKNVRGGRVVLVEAHRVAAKPAAEPPT
jgi:CBS domain containing-hemolysin-like protein